MFGAFLVSAVTGTTISDPRASSPLQPSWISLHPIMLLKAGLEEEGAGWEIIVVLRLLKKQRVRLPVLSPLASATLLYLLFSSTSRFQHSVTVMSVCVFPIGSMAG